MIEYNAIVIGSGCGMNIVESALDHGMSVALVDRGPLGGTCLNLGCIPSKMLIYAADRIVEIQEARKLGISAGVVDIDFSFMMERMRRSVRDSRDEIRSGIPLSEKLDFYEGEGHFVSDYTMEVNGETIKGDKIFIASGSSVLIPPIRGLDGIDYLTNESVLQLREKPASLIIIGGGYIAVEYGHFFAAIGTKVTIVEMADRLLLTEEPEISALLEEEMSRRMDIHTNALAEEVRKSGDTVTVVARDRETGAEQEFSAQSIMVAVGRKSNADVLKVENTGVELDEKGFIKTNDYLDTSKKNIWAVGDANGRYMFTHVSNREAAIAAHNALHNTRLKMGYSAIPHAVFSHPQIASVGLGEEAARKGHKVLIGRARYFDVAQGEAMMEETGFARAIVDKDTEKILGFHIIGPYAATLIQEVINAMASGGNVAEISAGLHIHPALPELIIRTLGNLEEPGLRR